MRKFTKTSIALLVIIVICLVLVQALIVRSPRSPIPQIAHEALPSSTTTAPTTKSSTSQKPVKFRPEIRNRQIQILDGPHFSVGYDNSRKNPAWVTYDIDGPIAFTGGAPTRPIFATDFRTTAHVSHRDYINSGYDRGHLVPAYAMWSRHGKDGFIATFTCSNIVPQVHEMNAGIWEDLEDNIAGGVRQGDGWAGKYRNLTIINGPIFDDNPAKLKTGIPIPSACFSIILDYQENLSTYRSLAFVIPNERSAKGPLSRWLTTIRRIEKATGLNVFAGEAEGLRASMEDALAGAVWAE